MYNLLDLFSGIGGFSLGLERSGGFKTVAFCEIESFCCKVLKKHWPEVPIYDDIRTLTASKLAADGIAVDAICGGFPCQDISVAGKGAGIDGARSGLWSEYARLVGELRPKYVIVENVAALLGRGLSRVLGDLAALGYDAEWHCIPASAVGAEHARDRIWIIAYFDQMRKLQSEGGKQNKRGWTFNSIKATSSDVDQARYSVGMQTRQDDSHVAIFAPWLRSSINSADTQSRDYWNYQPILGRGIHGIPNRVDRISALGNAVFPQIPEIIGRAIIANEQRPEPA